MSGDGCPITVSLRTYLAELIIPGPGDPPPIPPPTKTITFACGDAPDVDGNRWIWTGLPGWWESPAPEHSTIVLGQDPDDTATGEQVTNSILKPREIELQVTADCRGGSLTAARNAIATMTRFTLDQPGILTVDDSVAPRYAEVYLNDRPTSSLQAAGLLDVTFPFIAYDVYRHLVSTGAGIL